MPEVWLMATPTPDHYVDVTDTFEAKMRAIQAHVSQLPAPEEIESRVRQWLEMAAEQGGLPSGRLAEAFQVVATP